MASSIYDNIFKRLAQKELILPFFESAMMADNWPTSYSVKIDSSPYYGLTPEGKPDGYFHPSTHALMGARELYYRFHPDTRDQIISERRTLQSHVTLAIGSSLHGVVQTQMQMAGLITSEDDIELEYVNTDHHVRGRADFVVSHPNGERILVELKTQNTYAFNKQETVKPTWDAQLSLAADNLGFDFGILMVMETGWPYRMKEYRVPRNDTLLSEIYQKFDFVRESIALNKPPKYCCPYDSPAMKTCAARGVCWLAEEVDETGQTV